MFKFRVSYDNLPEPWPEIFQRYEKFSDSTVTRLQNSFHAVEEPVLALVDLTRVV